ncbi:MAG: CHAT domain-containing protein [Arcicella sp.]|jgi:CHAT domain-containing protein|nr:CHAT domain-containing protein [Arcicella sp.]
MLKLFFAIVSTDLLQGKRFQQKSVFGLKLLLVVSLFLGFWMTGLANCPTPKAYWLRFQQALQKKDNLSELLILKKIGKKCNFRDSTYTQILQVIAENYQQKQDLQTAQRLLMEAINLNASARKDINKIYLIDNYILLAKNTDRQGNYQGALNLYDRSITLSINFKDRQANIPLIYAQKANILSKMGDFEKAIIQANIGIDVALQRNELDLGAKCFIERAKAYNITGENENAKKDLQKVIEILRRKPLSSVLPFAYYHLGHIASSEKQYLQAIKYFEKAQEMFKNTHNDYDYSWTFVGIGFAHFNAQEYDKALESFTNGLNTMTRTDRKVLILDDIAASYWMKKDFIKAFQFYQKALSVAPIGFQSKTLFDNPTLNNLKSADFKSSYLTTLQDKADTWLEYYEYTKQHEHLRIALATYLTADKLIDLMRYEHTGTQSKLYWRNKTHRLYEQAIKTCFLLRNYEKAFYFFEKSKAVLLNDRLNELSAKQQLSKGDIIKEKEFQQKMVEISQQLATQKNNDRLQKELFEVQKQQEEFIKRLETTNPTYYKYKYDTTFVNLKQLQETFIKDQTLLEYFVGDNQIYALKIAADKVDLQAIPFGNYRENAKMFLAYCADNQKANKNFKGFLDVSNQLYKQLFKYVDIPKGRLIIAQDGFFIPFEALSKSSEKAEYLLNDYAISYTYSVQFLLKNLQEKTFGLQHNFMGMSPLNFHKNLNQSALRGSDVSLMNIADNFFQKQLFNHQEATKNNFLNHAYQYKVVHLYTHAQADSTDAEPMIYFQDSVLKLSELNQLQRFKTQLLVLSACKTAVGKNAKGEGILSLSRGFASLGIPATLTTLWSVQNEPTYTLNELFYRYLSEGYSKDIALQKAKLEFLQTQSGEKQLPTFWAAAILMGDSEAIFINYTWGYLLLGIVLVVGGLWWYRKKT